MSAISLKSITGITSITTPAGVDNQLTLHNNNTNEAVKLDIAGNLHINNQLAVTGVTTHYEDVLITTANGNNIYIDKSDNSIRLGESVGLFYGTNKMWMQHNGSVGYLHNVTGSLYIRNEDSSGDIYIQGKSGEHSIICNYDGAVELYFNDSKKFETTNTGATLTGATSGTTTTLNVTAGSGGSDIFTVGKDGIDTKVVIGGTQNCHTDLFLQSHLTEPNNINFGHSSAPAKGQIKFHTYNNYMSFSTGSTERLRIDGNGRVLIGHDSSSGDFHGPQTTTGRSPFIQLHGANAASAGAALISWKNQAGSYYAPTLYLAHSGSDTIGTNGILPSGGEFGSIVFSGDDGTDFVKGAMIKARLDGTPGNDDMPGRLEFHTTPDGAQAPVERLRITSGGSVEIDRGSASDVALLVNTTSTTNACRIGFNESGTRKAEIAYSHDNDQVEVIGKSGQGAAIFTNSLKRLAITSSGAVNIGGDYTQTTYGLSVRGGAVDQSTRFSNTKSSNGDIHYIGISLTNGGYGQALFGHTGHTTAGSQAAWMGLAGDDVAGGTGVKCFRGGKVQMGASTTLQAFINNSVSGHQFISQCSDNNNGFEIYQKHGSTATRKTLAVYANTGNSAAKQIQFEVRGDNSTHAYGTKNTTLLTLNTAQAISGAHSYGDENRLDFLMYNEVPQFTGNPAARIAGFLDRGNNGFGLRFYARYSAGTLYKAMEITADYEVLPGSNGTVDLGNASNRWKNVYTSDLDLSNEAKGGNDVDGTWGSYTIQEGESDLFLINKRNGKKYKFNLTEVS